MAEGDLTLETKWTRNGQSKVTTRTRPSARADQLIKASYASYATEAEQEAFGAPGDDPVQDAELLERMLWHWVVFEHNRYGARMHGRDATQMEP